MARSFLRETPIQPTTPSLPTGRYRYLTVEDLAHLPIPTWLIDNLIGKRNFAVLFGPPDSYKTFIALHLGLCVASGTKCLGRRVKQGTVLYVMGESEEGFCQRVDAWEEVHPGTLLDENRMIFLPEAIDLLDSEAVNDFITQAQKIRPFSPVLVIIDTLARCMVGGDENSARDVGIAIDAMDRIRRILDCTVLVLHHSTKSKDEVERGSGALRGAADTIFTVDKEVDVTRLRCVKQKDAAQFKPIPFRVREIELSELTSSLALRFDPSLELSGALRKTLFHIGSRSTGLTFSELELRGVPKTSLRRGLRHAVSMGLVRKPPQFRGGSYMLTDSGLAIIAESRRSSGASLSEAKGNGAI